MKRLLAVVALAAVAASPAHALTRSVTNPVDGCTHTVRTPLVHHDGMRVYLDGEAEYTSSCA